MFIPSRLFCGLVLVYFIFVALRSFNLDLKPAEGLFVNQMAARIVSEPKIVSGHQTFFVRPINKKFNIKITTEQFPKYEIGDTLYLTANLTSVWEDEYNLKNPGTFLINKTEHQAFKPKIDSDFETTPLFEQRDYWLKVRVGLVRFRKKIEKIIIHSLHEPESGLMAGILLGTRTELSQSQSRVLADAGLIHIIALSGYNITILIKAAHLTIKRYSASFSFWLSVIIVWFFVIMTGFSASVVRAAIMGTTILLAGKLGRQPNTLVAVFLASFLMVFLNPYILVFDVGFQLSFLAVIGIIYLAPNLQKMLRAKGLLAETVIMAFSAQILTLPLISYYFGRLSVLSIFSNLFVVPFLPMFMLIGFVAIVLAFFSAFASGLVFKLCFIYLNYILKVSSVVVSKEWSILDYKMSPLIIFLTYLLLFEVLFIVNRRGAIERKK